MTLPVSVRKRIALLCVAGALALASSYTPSDLGVDVVKEYEGKKNSAYLDPVRIPTICYGSTSGVKLGQHRTDAQCDQMLRRDLGYAGLGISKHVRTRITQGQYDALVSFVYNVGETQFRKSTMLRKINAGDCYGAGREFPRWVKAQGTTLPGLVTRRATERELFEKGCPAWDASNATSRSHLLH